MSQFVIVVAVSTTPSRSESSVWLPFWFQFHLIH